MLVVKELIPFVTFEPSRVRPRELANKQCQLAGWLAQIKHLWLTSQFASSPSCTAHCYTELAVSSSAVAETIASFHCRDEWALSGLENSEMVYPPKVVINFGTNCAHHCLALLPSHLAGWLATPFVCKSYRGQLFSDIVYISKFCQSSVLKWPFDVDSFLSLVHMGSH